MNICQGVYGDYAELDLDQRLADGLRMVSSEDINHDLAEMVVEWADPPEDTRRAARAAYEDGTGPAFAYGFFGFVIKDGRFGPTSQDLANMAICVTYCDDRNLVGRAFWPYYYETERGGARTGVQTPDSFPVWIKGTGRWRQAYWEISDLEFSGSDDGQQRAARFHASGKIAITRVRYAIIRPCGPDAGLNLLAGCSSFP